MIQGSVLTVAHPDSNLIYDYPSFV